MDFAEQESVDGLRFSWNVWPTSRLDTVRNVVPLGCFFTPVKEINGLHALPYAPLRCKCQAVLNPFCSTDYAAQMWLCPIWQASNHLYYYTSTLSNEFACLDDSCTTWMTAVPLVLLHLSSLQKNAFPHHYQGISTSNIPAELHEQSTAIEYDLDRPASSPPTFLLVVDICIDTLEVDGLRKILRQTLLLLPPRCLVGLITFASQVSLHHLGQEIPTAVLLQPSASPSKSELARLLRIGTSSLHSQAKSQGSQSRDLLGYLARAEDCEGELESIIEGLQAEQGGRNPFQRSLRATGTAVAVAVSLLELLLPRGGAHIMLFTSGPATAGKGMIVGRDAAEALRSHHDFEKGSLKHFSQALNHYDRLADRMNKCGHALDVFACSLDQVGIAEMHPAVHYTGGCMMMCESFSDRVASDCIARYFQILQDQALQFRSDAKLTLLCSQEVKIQGASGPCCSLGQGGPTVSDTVRMAGNTNAWRLSSLTPSTAVCLFLDVGPFGKDGIPEGRLLYLQFQTEYRHPGGQYRLRVVTTARQWADPRSDSIVHGFDQEAAMAMMARWMTFKLMEEEASEVAAWLDKCLIQLAARFGQYSSGQAESLVLPANFSMLPQWFFNLRRSPLMQVFGSSPDETAYSRHLLDRESVANCLIMIQPQLICFSMSQPPRAVLLDVQSIASEEILVLDTFFIVLIHYGSTIAEWLKARYADMPSYENFRGFLSLPEAEAERLVKGRYPVPKLLKVNQGGSQARFLLAKLNPSQTHEDRGLGLAHAGEIIVTEDVPFDVFYQHLSKAVLEIA